VRLTDAGGLYLEVTSNLSRRWFWKYCFREKEKRLALGHYTEPGSPKVIVSLKEARQAHGGWSPRYAARWIGEEALRRRKDQLRDEVRQGCNGRIEASRLGPLYFEGSDSPFRSGAVGRESAGDEMGLRQLRSALFVSRPGRRLT
jgi:hypothetical protein